MKRIHAMLILSSTMMMYLLHQLAVADRLRGQVIMIISASLSSPIETLNLSGAA